MRKFEDGKKESILKLINLKKFSAASALGVAVVLGTVGVANAQSDRNQDRRAARQQQKIEKQQSKIEQQRLRLQQQRQAEWTRRNSQIVTRRAQGSGYYTLDPNRNITEGRYRAYRNGRWYNTDHRGADLLRQAVNEGYRQGFNAGRADRSGSRVRGWSNSNVYRTGTVGYQNSVDRGQYQYYFRQGFQRGYQDGSNSQYREDYYGDYQYGTFDNGSPNILGTILNQILNLQSY